MPSAGIGGGWNLPSYQQPNYYNPTSPQTPSTPQNYYNSLPPPPVIPQPPAPPPYPTNPYLGNFNDLISKMLNYNFWGQLPSSVTGLIDSQRNAALQGFDVQSTQMQDQLLTRLFGSGFQRSSVAGEQSQQLADSRAAARAGVGAQYDNMTLQDMLTGGQAGMQALQSAGSLAGNAASIYNQGSAQYYNAFTGGQNSYYGALINSLMQQYGNQNQQYFGDRNFIEQIIGQILSQLIPQIGTSVYNGGGGVG